MTILTTPSPVKGKSQDFKILGFPLEVCSIKTTTLDPELTKSIAPPIPLTNFPGMIQLAISADCDTCIAPKMVKSMWPPLIMPNDYELEKEALPGLVVIVSFPALIKSASCSPFMG
jgi:hypothetical protein